METFVPIEIVVVVLAPKIVIPLINNIISDSKKETTFLPTLSYHRDNTVFIRFLESEVARSGYMDDPLLPRLLPR